MSGNQEYQNKIEQECLDFVRTQVNEKNCFGLSHEQFIELKNSLNKAEPNIESNKFPDFVFNSGFIEHFEITSSLEDKKGAKQKRESIRFKRDSEREFFKNINSNDNEVLKSNSFTRDFEEHSYSSIVASIKKNWSKHIKNYDKIQPKFENRIFLIEYKDINIQTAVLIKDKPAEVFNTYRISANKCILEWIYSYRSKIDYCIFVNILSHSVEVIRIDKILDLTDGIHDVRFEPVIGIERHKFINFKFKKDNI